MQNSPITEFQSDKDLMRTLMNNFGSVLVFIFYADWNQPSKQFLKNINNSIAIFGQYDNVKYFSLAAQKCPDVMKKFQVQKTPAVIFTQTDKKILNRYEGNDVGAVFDILEKLSTDHKNQFEKDKAIWHPKVKNIIESCPFIVFIKGSPQNPKCGFTRTILDIFKKHQVEYTYYDIIEDEQMRYWSRHYSQWPTYPAVFINGKLVGGLDKIKELVDSGQFAKMIPQSCKQSPPQQRYNKLINEHQTIVFTNGFSFQNQESMKAVEQAKKKYGDNITLYNVQIQKSFHEYLLQKVSKKVPFVVHKKTLTQ